MSRKRKSNDVEGGGDSSRNSKRNNDSKKKSKKQIDHQHVIVKTKIDKRPQLSKGGGGGADDAALWSKSKKKRMRNLKSRLLKKQPDPTSEPRRTNVETRAVASQNSSKHEQFFTATTTPTASASSSKQQQQQQDIQSTDSERQTNNTSTAASVASPHAATGPRKSALQQAFMARLSGSRFRILNEELYTTTSSNAFERFSLHPELYDEYHDGFRSQVQHWPVNPVDVIVGRLKKDYVDVFFDNNSESNDKNKFQKQNRINEQRQQIVVADFGCGDADLAKQLLQVQIPLPQQGGKLSKGSVSSSISNDDKSNTFWCPFLVHSFDLVSKSDLVTACDMSNVPLPNATVDVAVFCLSLMGTNLADFVREAHRVLKSSGRLKIAEVKSRFASSSLSSSSTNKSNNNQHTNSKNSRSSSHKKIISHKNNASGQEDDEREFIQVLKQLGFECTRTDRSNKMFVLFELCKNGKMPDRKVEYTAKPCIYKRR
jgi:ribosomal RNA-processing protein 8